MMDQDFVVSGSVNPLLLQAAWSVAERGEEKGRDRQDVQSCTKAPPRTHDDGRLVHLPGRRAWSRGVPVKKSRVGKDKDRKNAAASAAARASNARAGICATAAVASMAKRLIFIGGEAKKVLIEKWRKSPAGLAGKKKLLNF